MEREIHEAPPELRARLEAVGAQRWSELAGVPVAWVHSQAWPAHGETFLEPPRSIQELNDALRTSRAELDSEAGFEELMMLMELATQAKVTRTRDDLHSLTLDQPGPEVIRSGTLGERGLAAWEAPRRDSHG